MDKEEEIKKFMRLVKQDTDGHWIWQGHIRNDMPTIKRDKRHVSARNYAYKLFFRDPEGERIKPLCKEQTCVNPEHLVLASMVILRDNGDALLQAMPRWNQRIRDFMTECDHCEEQEEIPGTNLCAAHKESNG